MLNLLKAGYCTSLSPVHTLRRAAGTARPDSPTIASINVGRYLGGSVPQLARRGHRRCTVISGASYRPRESSDMPTQVLSSVPWPLPWRVVAPRSSNHGRGSRAPTGRSEDGLPRDYPASLAIAPEATRSVFRAVGTPESEVNMSPPLHGRTNSGARRSATPTQVFERRLLTRAWPVQEMRNREPG